MKFLSSLLFIISAQLMMAQEVATIEGKVVDIDNNPVPFASVYIPELHKGAAADADGQFSINNIPYGLWQLTASGVGYKAATVAINPNEPILSGIKFQLAFDN